MTPEVPEPTERFYVPSTGPVDQFVPPPGAMPRLHLVEYEGGLRLCEDATGLLVGPTDRRLTRAGLYVENLRGTAHYAAAAKSADLRAGSLLRLVPEPENPHDRNATAVHDADGVGPVGYINKQDRQPARHRTGAPLPRRSTARRGSEGRRPPAIAAPDDAAAPGLPALSLRASGGSQSWSARVSKTTTRLMASGRSGQTVRSASTSAARWASISSRCCSAMYSTSASSEKFAPGTVRRMAAAHGSVG